MKLTLLGLSLLIFFVLFPQISFAADYRVSGKILDQKNNPVPQGVVVFTDKSGKTTAAVTADFSGTYGIAVPQGTYTISANGPQNTGLQGNTLTDQTITSATVLNFTLHAPEPPVAKKPGLLQRAAPFITGIIVLLFLVGVYIFRRNNKSLPQTGSSH